MNEDRLFLSNLERQLHVLQALQQFFRSPLCLNM